MKTIRLKLSLFLILFFLVGVSVLTIYEVKKKMMNVQKNTGKMDGLYAHAPNSWAYQEASLQSEIEEYVMQDSTCCGACLNAAWGEIELSPGSYDFSKLDEQVKAWKSRGKKVSMTAYGVDAGLGIGGVSPIDGDYHSFTPAYVIEQVPILSVQKSDPPAGFPNEIKFPVYWYQEKEGSFPYRDNFRRFCTELVSHYKAQLSYVRFAVGMEGEDFVAPDLDSAINSATLVKLKEEYSYSLETWQKYSLDQITFMKTISGIQLAVGINTVPEIEGKSLTLAQAVASAASEAGIMFGSQGLGGTYATSGNITGLSNIYKEYAGKALLEGQTASNTTATREGNSLPQIIDFAIQNQVNILELYVNEWITANSRKDSLGQTYHNALKKAADYLGCK